MIIKCIDLFSEARAEILIKSSVKIKRFTMDCSDAGTGGARGATGPPIFGGSVNPIPTGEG
jgi:hypothetical protein